MQLADAVHRLLGHRETGVVQERNQQVPAPATVDVAKGAGEVAARGTRRLSRIGREGRQGGLPGRDVLRPLARDQGDGGGGHDLGRAIHQQRPRELGRILAPDARERANGRRPHLWAVVADHPLDHLERPLRHRCRCGAQHGQRACANGW